MRKIILGILLLVTLMPIGLAVAEINFGAIHETTQQHMTTTGNMERIATVLMQGTYIDPLTEEVKPLTTAQKTWLRDKWCQLWDTGNAQWNSLPRE